MLKETQLIKNGQQNHHQLKFVLQIQFVELRSSGEEHPVQQPGLREGNPLMPSRIPQVA